MNIVSTTHITGHWGNSFTMKIIDIGASNYKIEVEFAGKETVRWSTESYELAKAKDIVKATKKYVATPGNNFPWTITRQIDGKPTECNIWMKKPRLVPLTDTNSLGF